MEKKKYTLAIVDDSPLVRALVSDLVEDIGMDLIGEADNVEAGIEICLTKKPDVVILDINMPSADEKKSGIDVCSELRKTIPRTKIIMLTSSGQRADIIQAIKMGANDYIMKPFDEIKLRNSLQKVLEIDF